jgi:hypothetical protein
MAITDRDAISAAELEDIVRLEPNGERHGAAPLSGPGRVLLAALSLGAGVIHLVMVPSHASEWLPEGIGFAVAGWAQIGLALLLLVRPSRGALRATCLLNLVLVGLWIVSRTVGLPVGPEAGVAHAASFVDLTCVALEVALVLAAGVLLVRPTAGAGLGDPARVMLSAIPIGILLVATAAIASPSAADHGHSAAVTAAGGHEHGDVGATATGASSGASGVDGHDHGAATTIPVDDKGLSKIMNGKGEGGGHTHNDTVVPVDAATQQLLDAQLAHTKPLIAKYPTVKDAEAAGYHRQGPFSPGLGAHYSGPGATKVSFGPTLEGDALDNPMLIFDGIDPDSKLAGFMYNIFSLDTQNPPEGFAGPNDHWHYHTDVCLVMRPDGGVDAPLGADASATKELCDKYNGRLIANTGYMAHVWPVPGYESPQGLFSNLNAKITCPNGTYYIVAQEEIGTRSNACKDVP